MGNSSNKPQIKAKGTKNSVSIPSQLSFLELLMEKYQEQGKEFLRAQSSYQKTKLILMSAINKNGAITHQRNLDSQYLENCIFRLQEHYITEATQAQKMTPNILQSFIEMYKKQPQKWTGLEETKAQLHRVVFALKSNYEKEFTKLYEEQLNLISRTTIPEYELLSYRQKQELLNQFDRKYPPPIPVKDFEKEIDAFKDILQKKQLQSFLRKSELAIALKFKQMRELVHAKCYGCCVFLN